MNNSDRHAVAGARRFRSSAYTSTLVLTLRSVVLVRVCTRSTQDAFSAPRYLRANEKFMQKLFRYEFRESFESVPARLERKMDNSP